MGAVAVKVIRVGCVGEVLVGHQLGADVRMVRGNPGVKYGHNGGWRPLGDLPCLGHLYLHQSPLLREKGIVGIGAGPSFPIGLGVEHIGVMLVVGKRHCPGKAVRHFYHHPADLREILEGGTATVGVAISSLGCRDVWPELH